MQSKSPRWEWKYTEIYSNRNTQVENGLKLPEDGAKMKCFIDIGMKQNGSISEATKKLAGYGQNSSVAFIQTAWD
jgi:hypothetical protein